MDEIQFLGLTFNRFWVIAGAIALAAIVAIYYGYTLARKSRKSQEDNPQGR
jgi:hypothetical protein